MVAYIIDLLVVYCDASLISTPFLNQNASDKLAKEMVEVTEKYESGEISSNDYVASYSGISYRIARNTGIYSIVTIFLEIIYFVVFLLSFN